MKYMGSKNRIANEIIPIMLKERKENHEKQSCTIPLVIKSVCKYGMNPDDCIRKADTCFDCLKDS